MYIYIYACTFVFAYSCHPFTHCHPNPKHTAAEAAVIPPNQNPPGLCRELGTHVYGGAHAWYILWEERRAKTTYVQVVCA